MEPIEAPALTPRHSLWGEWLLDEYSTTRLRVIKLPQALSKDIGRQILTTIAASAIAFALALSIYANVWDTALLTWPLVALFSAVAVLGLLGILRAARQAFGGIRLEVDIQQKALWGVIVPRAFWKDYMAKVQRYDLQQAHAVTLRTYHHAGAERRSNRAMCKLVVKLHDGQCLQGPDVLAPESTYGDAEERLRPLAEAIAQMANIPLELREEPLPPPPRKPFAFLRPK
jgi:hypothetical protein